MNIVDRKQLDGIHDPKFDIKQLQIKKNMSKDSKNSHRKPSSRYSGQGLINQTQMAIILTESKKNEIKNQIGQAFLDILKKATIRIILQKESVKRTEEEIDRIIKLLKGFEFFQSNKKLSYCDYRDLAQMMTYKEYEPDSIIYDFDQSADNFFVVLNG